MFGDFGWESACTDHQITRMRLWLDALGRGSSLVILECGAGQAVPTVRIACQNIADKYGGTLVRINTREHDVPPGHVSLPMGALAALAALDARIRSPEGGAARSSGP